MFPTFLEKRAGSAATPFIKQSWAKFLGVMNSIVEKVEKEQRTWFCHDLCVWPLREGGCIDCVTCILDDLCVTFTTGKWRLSAKYILWPLPVKTRCDLFLPVNATSSLKKEEEKVAFPCDFFLSVCNILLRLCSYYEDGDSIFTVNFSLKMTFAFGTQCYLWLTIGF